MRREERRTVNSKRGSSRHQNSDRRYNVGEQTHPKAKSNLDPHVTAAVTAKYTAPAAAQYIVTSVIRRRKGGERAYLGVCRVISKHSSQELVDGKQARLGKKSPPPGRERRCSVTPNRTPSMLFSLSPKPTPTPKPKNPRIEISTHLRCTAPLHRLPPLKSTAPTSSSTYSAAGCIRCLVCAPSSPALPSFAPAPVPVLVL